MQEELTHPFFQFLGFTIVFVLFVSLICLCIGLVVFVKGCIEEILESMEIHNKPHQ